MISGAIGSDCWNRDSGKSAQWNMPGARAVVKGAATLDGDWKSVEGATVAEKAAMRFFKVVVVVP